MKRRLFFPLDSKLKLRQDRWSEGVAQIATMLGLQAKSFRLAATNFEKAVGSGMSVDSIRRVTENWGTACYTHNRQEMEKLYALDDKESMSHEPGDQIVEQANLSTDGGMLLIRDEGWKEVKLVAISAVRDKRENERIPYPDGRRYAPWEPQKTLERHSYQAILGSADEVEPYQYLEGVRRGLPTCGKISAVSDAAIWIERITSTNFPQAQQIIDWFHAVERLWQVGKVCFPDKVQRKAWVKARQDELWQGDVEAVVTALHKLSLPVSAHEDIGDTPGYFERHKERMRYHRYRVVGYPIGSGTVESAVNCVVHHRLKRQGRGWQRDNAHAMLAALCELHSGRFDTTWALTQ